jgi:hypothetical protein
MQCNFVTTAHRDTIKERLYYGLKVLCCLLYLAVLATTLSLTYHSLCHRSMLTQHCHIARTLHEHRATYTVYLEQKDPLAYTGPEHHAALMFQDKNNFARLIPIKKALAFRRAAGTIRETQGTCLLVHTCSAADCFTLVDTHMFTILQVNWCSYTCCLPSKCTAGVCCCTSARTLAQL